MSESTLIHQTEGEDGSVVVAVDGSIDTLHSLPLRRVLDEACQKPRSLVLVDCSNLSYINSSSCGMFFHYHRMCEERGGRLVLCGASDKILAILKTLGLLQLLHIAATPEESRVAVRGE